MISFLPIYNLTETKMTKHRKVQHSIQWESNMLFKLVAHHKFFIRSCCYKPELLLGSTERLFNSIEVGLSAIAMNDFFELFSYLLF